MIHDLLKLAKTAAEAAGNEILAVYGPGNFSISRKADASPLTLADSAAHAAIKEALGISRLPLLSEEGAECPFAERRTWPLYWLVDPLDGTKEFIKRNGEFTVNIALIKDGEPVAGVVYAPSLGKLYYGAKGEGAFKRQNGAEVALPKSKGKRFTDLLAQETVTVVASRSHSNPETEAFAGRFKKTERRLMGSSLKFMLLAEGEADIYPRLAPTMEWDTAAAHAILKALNRNVFRTDFSGELRYNKEALRNPPFIAF